MRWPLITFFQCILFTNDIAQVEILIVTQVSAGILKYSRHFLNQSNCTVRYYESLMRD